MYLILYVRMKKTLFVILMAGFAGLQAACISSPPGISAPVPWTALPGWQQDNLAQAWPALLNSCRKMPARDASWLPICADAAPDDDTARAFFETRFRAHEVTGNDGKPDGLITGYYEPLLYGSLVRTERFRYPLYKRPDDLVTVDLGENASGPSP